MKLKVQENCPLNDFKECMQFKCGWFIHVNGQDPNTGEHIEEWGCSMAWLPKILIENAQMSRQTGAAVENFRNEIVRQNQQTFDFMRQAAALRNGSGDMKTIK